MAATKTSLVTAEVIDTRTEIEQLPTLFTRLGDDVLQLFNSQVALFRVEVREEANAYAQKMIMISVGALIGAIGFALVNVALALGVSTLFSQANFTQPISYALGFVIAGVFYLVVGGILIAVFKNRMAKQQMVPKRTAAELRKDKEWLKNEL